MSDSTEMDSLDPPYVLQTIGHVVSSLKNTADAPKQGGEGAPSATLVLAPEMVAGLDGLEAGMQILVLTWLDRARRDLLVVRPRADPANRERGVFSTRSPVRPNPIGIHPVRILSIDGGTIEVDGIEAVDQTPIIDIKPVRGPS